MDIAKEVSKIIKTEIVITESNDPRSYRQDSTKLENTGFKPSFNIEKAILEIKEKYLKRDLPDGDNCYTVKWMKNLDLQA